MNYLAHGFRFVDDPYFLAGTAAPDWLNVIDRKMRLRSKTAALWQEHADPRYVAFAKGVMQHHHDDDWFHSTTVFTELSLQFTLAIRDLLGKDDGFRPSFLGHILVELLLDNTLAEENHPGRLSSYYAAMRELDPYLLQTIISSMATKPSDKISQLIPRFIDERFLYDYADDQRLLIRLGHVMRRVGLPPLPAELASLFPAMRKQVTAARKELTVGMESST
ncbi:MAG: hypothetical protein ACO1RA_21030 [Planctomycetaceae bacterium]